jgi:hypothetical protein
MKNWGIASIAIMAILFALVLVNPLQWFLVKLKIEEQIGISVTNEIPLVAKIDQQVVIEMADKLQGTIHVEDEMVIALDEVIDVPLELNIPVSLDTEVYMDEILNLKFDLPLHVTLSPEELGLHGLKIPFNESLYIEDELAVDFEVAMDTKIKTRLLGIPFKIPAQGSIPVKTTIPIRQALNVKDTITLTPMDYTVEFNALLPVEAAVPVDQMVNIKGGLIVPVRQQISIPLKKVVTAPVLNDFNATVSVNNAIAVDFNSDLNATAGFSDTMTVSMGELVLEPDEIKIIREKRPR